MRIPPGEKTRDKFIKIEPTDFGVGDSVFARGRISEDRKNLPALEFYVMSKGDIAQKRERENDEWRKRGIAGTITALKPETNEISVDSEQPKDQSRSLLLRLPTPNFDGTRPIQFASVMLNKARLRS